MLSEEDNVDKGGKKEYRFMKGRPWYDKVSFGIAILAGICTVVSCFDQIGLLRNKSVDSQVNIAQLADAIINENSIISENMTVSGNAVMNENDIINENSTIGDNNIIGNYNTVINQYDAESREEQKIEINKILQELSLGLHEEYVKELLGTPMYQLSDNQLINEFYVLDEKIIIRCIFEENHSMVGYIVTAKKADESIEFPDPMHNNMVLKYGYSTIDSFESDTYKGEMTANLGNGDAYNYYWQCYHLVHTEEVNGFIVAILPYGFYEKYSCELMRLVGADEIMLSEYAKVGIDVDKMISDYKKQLHPNTYGVIDIDYKEYICPYIYDKAVYWESCVKKFLEI